MDLPSEPEEAARLAATGEQLRRFDLGRMGDRPFVNVASVGLPRAAAHRANGLKRLLGPAAYAVGGIRAGLTADPVRCRASCDGQNVFSGDAWQLTVACSGAFGGGSQVEANPRDGCLDVVAIPAGSRASLALRAYGLRRGNISSQSSVRTCRGTAVRLDVPPGTGFNVDGELVSESGPVAFSVEPHSFQLVVG
jgi:diacylglycerol kinase family enzyme